MINRKIFSCANKFWRLAGKSEPFPRSLESSVAWALPLAIVKLPHLGLGDISNWLTRNGIYCVIDVSDHPLRAYLIARAGKGIVFLDGTDSDDERRFSLAHEVAHFILDYLIVREKTLKTYGEEVRDVLDGIRMPTALVGVKGIFRGIKLGTYSHLIARSVEGNVEKNEVLQAEDNADLLALELLAPKMAVLQRLEKLGVRWKEETAFQTAQYILTNDFGLPVNVARTYGHILVFSMRPAKSMKEWLGI